MHAYKTYAHIEASGRIVLEGLPFREGAMVEVLLVAQNRAERADSWAALMRHVQNLPQAQTISDADIAAEIAAFRDSR